MKNKKETLKAVKEAVADPAKLDLEMKDAPLVVEKLYKDFLKNGFVDKHTYQEVKRLHKEYITPDIELCYRYSSIPKDDLEAYNVKLEKMKEDILKDVEYPAEGNAEYLKNPDKYKEFDKAKKRLNSQSKALFNKHFKNYRIKIDKKGTVKIV